MDDEEKKLTAYHEAGHALVQGVLDDGHMPVHKVTIIPRGRSLGSTMFIPKKDVLTQAMKRMLNQIAMGLGGRIAEELVIGDISSGAAGDIKQITALARHMVCDWGMSPLGPIAYGDNHDTVFLGRDITRTENVSEETARKIDVEIQRIITEQYERAKKIISERRPALDKIAAALLEHETLGGQARPGDPRVRRDPLADRRGVRRQAGREARGEEGGRQAGRRRGPGRRRTRASPDAGVIRPRAAAPGPFYGLDLPGRAPTWRPISHEDLLHWRRLRRRAHDGDDRAQGARHRGEGGGHERRADRRLGLGQRCRSTSRASTRSSGRPAARTCISRRT